MAIARSLGINSTPTLILPNGQIAPGYKPLEALLELIDQSKGELKIRKEKPVKP